MYLKTISIKGFKSFADHTIINLDDKINAIVGPNGSGKSNIVDAIKWVLGEQSPKNLRGESMHDVIFDGSLSRSSQNIATVELIFDNSDSFIKNYPIEISIKRKVYRTGESEYYLNNKIVRLKDITNILLDTGINKESFNMIAQGEVDKIISNSSQDRKIIIEQASGILKYKKRKEEASNKLSRTQDNLNRVNDIIKEIEERLEPLKNMRDKAIKYNENKVLKDKYSISLLAYDINELNAQINNLNIEKEQLNNTLIINNNNLSKSDINNNELIDKINDLENKKNVLNNELLSLKIDIEKKNNQINYLSDTNDFGDLDSKIKEKDSLINSLNQIESKIKLNLKQDSDYKINRDKELENLSNIKRELNFYTSQYNENIHKIESLKYQINIIKNTNNNYMPKAVEKILSNNNLKGILNTLGNILKIDSKFDTALYIAISSSKNFIITQTSDDAKEAVEYLKTNKLGRATFYPIDTIKSRYVDRQTLDLIENDVSYLGVLSDLVEFNEKYRNIVENQLGIVIVVDNLDNAYKISKKIGNKYKIVTLDGDVINVGGSIVGGSINKTNPISDINKLQEQLNLYQNNNIQIDININDTNNKINNINNNINSINNNIDNISSLNDNLNNEKYNIESKINNINNIIDKLSIDDNSKEKKLLDLKNELYELDKNQKSKNIEVKYIDEELIKLKTELDNLNYEYRIQNKNINKLQKDINEKEILINRKDVELNSKLSILREEYEMSIEKATADYPLDLDVSLAREKLKIYDDILKEIGMVDLNSIEEYDNVNEKYSFLIKQRDDLTHASDTLMDIMNQMDKAMIEKFKSTFVELNVEFNNVFKSLFGGGCASLSLTDPDNILDTGVNIDATPPGKKLTSITLLSGGEKTLCAISLLFAILNIKNVPFCVFDEVEAALDNDNVDRFGKYLENYKSKTQFIIITHKNKTMEYAQNLYGITMQEEGVSKLVSVKLEGYLDTI